MQNLNVRQTTSRLNLPESSQQRNSENHSVPEKSQASSYGMLPRFISSTVLRHLSFFAQKRHLATTVGIFREWLNWSTHDFYLPRRWQQLPYLFSQSPCSERQKLPGRVASDASRFTEEVRGFEFFEGGKCQRAGGEVVFLLKKRDTKLQVGEVFDSYQWGPWKL